MPVENEHFKIYHIKWRYQDSRAITGDRNPRKPVRAGVNSLSVKCNKCGSEWTANRGNGDGKFTETIGYIHIRCNDCGIQGEIANQLLNQL